MSNANELSLPMSHTFRATMGRFVTGVTIITSTTNSGHVGMTVNSLTSVSLDPCLLLICLRKGSITSDAIRDHGRFAINLLSADQEELAMRFARPTDDRFRGLDYTLDDSGLPLITGCAAHIVCDLHAVHDAGDHDILIGQVVQALHDCEMETLAFRSGKFGLYTQRNTPVAG